VILFQFVVEYHEATRMKNENKKVLRLQKWRFLIVSYLGREMIQKVAF